MQELLLSEVGFMVPQLSCTEVNGTISYWLKIKSLLYYPPCVPFNPVILDGWNSNHQAAIIVKEGLVMVSRYISAVDECAPMIKLVITAILGLLLQLLILTSLLLDWSMQSCHECPFIHKQTDHFCPLLTSGYPCAHTSNWSCHMSYTWNTAFIQPWCDDVRTKCEIFI